MREPSKDISADKVRKLLERYPAREAFRILATNILSRDQPVEERVVSSQVETEARKITISKKVLRQLRNERTELVRMPADEDEARRLVQKWRNGRPVKTRDLVGIILYSDMTAIGK